MSVEKKEPILTHGMHGVSGVFANYRCPCEECRTMREREYIEKCAEMDMAVSRSLKPQTCSHTTVLDSLPAVCVGCGKVFE